MLPPNNRRSKIRPPRKSLISSSIDTTTDPIIDFDKSWAILGNAITQIQNKNVSSLSYEQLYRKAYLLVLRKFGGKLYDNVTSLITKHLLARREYLVSRSINIQDNGEFMKLILQEWNEHLQSMKFISDVLMYLNRVYVKEHHKLLIYDLGIQLFKDYVIKYNNNEVGQKLVDIVIEEITLNRNGKFITSNMHITKIINMMELLVEINGLDLQYGDNYYQSIFEPIFLSSSETFFYKFTQECCSFSNGSRYLTEINQFIRDEEYRINLYLPTTTYPKLVSLMNNILIKDKIDSMISLPVENEGLSFWLLTTLDNVFKYEESLVEQDDGHQVQLAILYDLIGRIDPEYQLLKMRLREIIILQGASIAEFIRNSSAEGKKSATSFANKWIDFTLLYYKQLKGIWSKAFSMNSIIDQTITISMREFINSRDSKDQSSDSSRVKKPSTSVNAPEMLSIYMDDHIKKIHKSSLDLSDVFINKSISFLKFIKDKDSFEANYANHFAKRFLNSKSQVINSSNKVDLEELIISKITEEMGTSSLDKVIKMNKDIKLSKDITKEWKTYLSERRNENMVDIGINSIPIDLELKICNVNDWPKSMTKDYKSFSTPSSFIWSKELRSTIKQFEEFWLTGKKNHNKSLYWSPKFGSIDFRITYPSRTYEINMSTYAGIIMLLFAPQSYDEEGSLVLAFDVMREFTYDQIKELTGIPDGDLVRHLQSIAVAPRLRLLIKLPMTKDVKNTDVFKLNSKFKSPSIKVKVLTVSASSSGKGKSQKTEAEEEAEEVKLNILEGRKMEVNAAIVRIMKSRHSILHHELIEELIKQLSNRFHPLMIMIKQRIEDLIEKEYLKRDEDERNLYHYVA